MPFQLLLAPIRGVTDATFRAAFAQTFGGFDRAISPFLLADKARAPTAKAVREAAAQQRARLPTIPQILAEDADSFLAVATRLEEAGCDAINWNLGCPHPMVTRRGRGAGLLPFPQRIDTALGAIRRRLRVHLSVKVRLGLHDPSDILAVLDVLDRHELDEVIVHPRTADQMYGGRADADAFAALLGRTRHALVYNGDVRDVQTFCALRDRLSDVDRWMVGRGALMDPLLGERLRGCEPRGEETERLRDFHDTLLRGYESALCGQAHILDRMHALWGYLGMSFGHPAKQRLKKILKARTLQLYREQVQGLFDTGASHWEGGLHSKY